MRIFLPPPAARRGSLALSVPWGNPLRPVGAGVNCRSARERGIATDDRVEDPLVQA